ncbi:acyl-CoA-binding protein [Lentiprolixibacter aurantiacus]|uniref:Acyl-CoA-binding protein n=1 Tax=Lentiprolixibacter aurantiacus TaxID=2993939 RepID=A0AAE3SNA5_9FLAO|nr:acyl-CoA-binding protein [Lentiprolixibacter aurantiacus]MCX2719280.1 acyl-CoA-binding protein [Lentiprolixibacter aurantiacus]
MKNEKLYLEFQEAVTYINGYTDPIPADLLLKLYAYYKIANENFDNPGSKTPLINAFKANALIQASDIGQEEAMQNYIELVAKLRKG